MVSAATTHPAVTKRALVLHDALAFLALLAVSIALFGVTLFLFRSFEQRRADLAKHWAEQGRRALQHNHPEEAVGALRTALSYTSDGKEATGDQLLLAQALADSGHTDEAQNYFLNLWDTHPGDGFINLQLARLARQRQDNEEAANYYRASIFGSWEIDGMARRRDVRLELIDFLISQHQFAEARNELYTVAGNAPDDVAVNLIVGEKLEAAGYLPDALSFYTKTVAANPHSREALVHAGRAAYTLGDYAQAEKVLNQALDEKPEERASQQELEQLARDSRRIVQLDLTRDQPSVERAQHLATAEKIAELRLRSCIAALTSDPALADVLAQWTALKAGPPGARKTLLQNSVDQDTWTQLIYRTEQITAKSCGAPTGDDALLLQLANHALPPPAALQVPAAAPAPAPTHTFSHLFGRDDTYGK